MMANPARTRMIMGCMSGTSLDGIDAALTRVTGSGLAVRADVVTTDSRTTPAAVRRQLEDLTGQATVPPHQLARLARVLGDLHADLIEGVWARSPAVPIDFVVAHGQTIWHEPAGGLSWQLFDPWPIVHRLKLPVVFDLRQADMIAGGQGAPITPISDWVMYRHDDIDRCVVNLGGVCNVTHLPAGRPISEITAADIGPCNLLIDGVVQHLWPGELIDVDGKLASVGKPDPMVRSLVYKTSRFFDRPLPRTTGREDFSTSWVDQLISQASTHLEPHDLLASAVDAVAQLLADHMAFEMTTCQTAPIASCGSPIQTPRPTPRTPWPLPAPRTQVVLAGGGANNAILVNRIRHHLPACIDVVLSNDLGIPAQVREPMAMAVLGALIDDGVAIALPQVTGSAHRPTAAAGLWAYPLESQSYPSKGRS